MSKNFNAMAVIPVGERQNETVTAGIQDDIYTVNEYEIDFKRVSIAGVVIFAILCWWCLLHLGHVFMFDEYSLILSYIIVAIGFLIALYKIDLQQSTIWINGAPYQARLNKTHDWVYRVRIQVSEWSNNSRTANVITFYKRRITAYKDVVEFEIHCPWATQGMPSNAIPMEFVDDKNEHRRAFEMVKSTFEIPDLTGKVLFMQYAGQRKKADRFPRRMV